MAAHRGGRDDFAEPAGDATAGDAVGDAELDAGAVLASLAQTPAAALIDTGDRVPGHVVGRAKLDDLDQASDFRGANPDQHPVAGAEARARVALDLPAGDA